MYSDICEGVGVSVFSIYPQDSNVLKSQRFSWSIHWASHHGSSLLELDDEVTEWLDSNVPDGYKVINNGYQIEVWIYDQSKAMLFKMRWG